MRRGQVRRANRRRGVTLLEMLVVVALVVLMMLILTSIFQAATGAMSAMRTYQELDDNLRLLDLTLRADLSGVTAKMTPPNNPAAKSGYFEYGENAPADLQGEDTDDYLAFTTKAPEGRVFTGRCWVPVNTGLPGAAAGATPTPNQALLPVTISSKYAEVIYFLRNGNLYRRVLLIVPERKGAMSVSGVGPAGVFSGNSDYNQFLPNMFNNGVFNPAAVGIIPVGWLGVNDISAHPNDGPNTQTVAQLTPVPNDLGDLTNRENRFARQRFARDLFDAVGFAGGAPTFSGGRDGTPDDLNANLIPDYYPTLTSTQVAAWVAGNTATAGGTPTLINDHVIQGPPLNRNFRFAAATPNDLYAFPFVFPGMYSVAEPSTIEAGSTGPGWLHAVDPAAKAGIVTVGGTNTYANHAPLEFGDSLPAPSGPQTWWGFPTFRETASFQWRDPVYFPGVVAPNGAGATPLFKPVGQQVRGLQSLATSANPASTNSNLLPTVGSQPPLGIPSAKVIPFGFDNVGYLNATPPPFVTLTSGITVSQATTAEQLSYVWDDDLIMTGVRSFDVKALDINASVYNINGVGSGYYDLGYASSMFVAAGGAGANTLLTATPTSIMDGAYGNGFGNPMGFGHEGRMPPLAADNRLDPQRPYLSVLAANNNYIINDANGNPVVGANNVGDNSAGLTRLRRVWDSWSTDYTNAPMVDAFGNGAQFNAPNDRPVYPSYPPPYPQAMRGIQVQIRVVDPKNEKVKVLTIRQDFSDKL